MRVDSKLKQQSFHKIKRNKEVSLTLSLLPFSLKRRAMKFLGLVLPMWACSISLFSSTLVARPLTTVSTFFTPMFLAGKEPIPQFSSKMEAESPGMSTVTGVFSLYVHCLAWVNGFALFQNQNLRYN